MVFRAVCLTLGVWISGASGQQMADATFDTSVPKPTYVAEHPKVMIDEGHRNFHTAEGRYKPFADLLRHDGYAIVPGTGSFTPRSFDRIAVLVIANALGEGANAGTDTSPAAFTQAECVAVRDWVRGGGSLLLISDHAPFGMAAEGLGTALGVKLGNGFVFATDSKFIRDGEPTMLVFSRENGLLGEHAITRGRNESERVNRVVAFTGESLSVPEGAVALMKLAESAREAPSRRELQDASSSSHSAPAHGAQGIAMSFGKGKVVVLGEAAMVSAQVIRRPNQPEWKMGMNAPGSDDRQFALNVLHWLSGALK